MTGSKSCLHWECHCWKQVALHQPGQSSRGLSYWLSAVVVAAAAAETAVASAAAVAEIAPAAAETDPQMVELHPVPQLMNHSSEET